MYIRHYLEDIHSARDKDNVGPVTDE